MVMLKRFALIIGISLMAVGCSRTTPSVQTLEQKVETEVSKSDVQSDVVETQPKGEITVSDDIEKREDKQTEEEVKPTDDIKLSEDNIEPKEVEVVAEPSKEAVVEPSDEDFHNFAVGEECLDIGQFLEAIGRFLQCTETIEEAQKLIDTSYIESNIVNAIVNNSSFMDGQTIELTADNLEVYKKKDSDLLGNPLAIMWTYNDSNILLFYFDETDDKYRVDSELSVDLTSDDAITEKAREMRKENGSYEKLSSYDLDRVNRIINEEKMYFSQDMQEYQFTSPNGIITYIGG